VPASPCHFCCLGNRLSYRPQAACLRPKTSLIIQFALNAWCFVLNTCSTFSKFLHSSTIDCFSEISYLSESCNGFATVEPLRCDGYRHHDTEKERGRNLLLLLFLFPTFVMIIIPRFAGKYKGLLDLFPVKIRRVRCIFQRSKRYFSKTKKFLP
jgi:hypothetical protein